MPKIPRFIFVFSNWIFVWYLLFMVGLIKANPYLLLIIAYVVSLKLLHYLYKNNINLYNLIKFNYVKFFSKIIPLLSLCILNLNKIDYYDVYFTLGFVISYLIFMRFMGLSFYDFYARLLNTYLNGKDYKTLGQKEVMIYDKAFGFIYEKLDAFFRKIILNR